MSKVTEIEVATPAQQLDLTANIYQGERWYVAECVELGTVSQGRSIEEAVSNLQEATNLYLEDNLDAFRNLPQPSLEQGVRELEAAYSRYIGTPVEPSEFNQVATVHFTIDNTYA